LLFFGEDFLPDFFDFVLPMPLFGCDPLPLFGIDPLSLFGIDPFPLLGSDPLPLEMESSLISEPLAGRLFDFDLLPSSLAFLLDSSFMLPDGIDVGSDPLSLFGIDPFPLLGSDPLPLGMESSLISEPLAGRLFDFDLLPFALDFLLDSSFMLPDGIDVALPLLDLFDFVDDFIPLPLDLALGLPPAELVVSLGSAISSL
jgi:hypothetical protein